MRMLAIQRFIKLLFVILTIVSNSYLHASQQDSLFISNQFREVLVNPAQRNSILKKISLYENDSSDQNRIWYFTELVKFNIQIGNLHEAEKLAWKGLKLKNNKSNASQGIFYNLLASIKSLQKEYDEAIKYFQKSIEIHTQHGNLKAAAYVKNNIANIFFSLADYESAHKYISEAHQTVLSLNDTLYLPPILGVLAVSEVKLNRLLEAKKHAELCLKLSAQYNNVLGEIIGNYTLGEYWLQKNAYEKSKLHFLKSQEIAEKNNQLFYVMLSKIGVSQVANKTNQFDEALRTGLDALEIAETLQNKNVQYTILKQLSVSYFGKRNFEQAYLMLDKAHEILRTNADEQNRRIINDILIQYETAEKEKELIANRLMIKSQELASNRLKQGIGILIFLVFIALIFFIIQRKLQRQKQQFLENERKIAILHALVQGEEKERNRISNELHDGIASGLSGVKMLLEINPEKSEISAKIVSQLANLHEETRRISHNLSPLKLQQAGIIEALRSFCFENSNSDFRIHFYTNVNKLSLHVDFERMLYRIIQELIQNVIKHAEANNCSVQIKTEMNKISIFIEDDGKGFDVNAVIKKQGLESIKQRITFLNGQFSIESFPGKGCFVFIELCI